MKKLIFLSGIVFLFFIIGCGKKKEQELTPLNAPMEYGKIIERTMKKAKAMDSIIYLRNKINTFQLQEGRYPKSLDELIEKGYINKEEMPKPPEGMQFVYDPKTGKLEVK
ncbi:MAG: hypothetical protein NC917_00925 [Candidatus Omnitrophica bacterium]|nr:hypothetical protein [Candidatus Omnitrophota bacterium]MCM8810201.1 hypothetical protein [Candidatus Omnitrophota bacterium]